MSVMHLHSLLRSSSIEILLSKRAITFLYLFIGLSVLVHAASSETQFISTHFAIREFDVSASEYVWITLIFFIPFWSTGALIIRAVIQRARIALWSRRAFQVTTYDSHLLPAAAGIIVDYEYNHREMHATLIDLYLKGVIELKIVKAGIEVTVLSPKHSLTYYEAEFLDILFAQAINDTITLSSLYDEDLIIAAEAAHVSLINSLQTYGLVSKEKLQTRFQVRIFRIIYLIAAYVGIVSLYYFLFRYEIVSNIMYPRYPTYSWQVALSCVSLLFVLGIIVSGFWPRLPKGTRKDQVTGWIETLGLMSYIRRVYHERFSKESLHTQDISSIKQYYAFALAFGIAYLDESTLETVIDRVKNK